MKMLTALNALGTIATLSAPHTQNVVRTASNACPSTNGPVINYIDPNRDMREDPLFILSKIGVTTAEPFNFNKYHSKPAVALQGEDDPLAQYNFTRIWDASGDKVGRDDYTSSSHFTSAQAAMYHDRFYHTVDFDGKFASTFWVKLSSKANIGLMNPPGTAVKIKFTFKNTKSYEEQDYTLYYNVGQYGNPIHAFLAIIPGNKTVSGTSTLNIKSMSYDRRSVYVPSIFGHRVSLTDFKFTALDRGLKIINPYLAHGDGGHDGVHGDYTHDYLDGFNTGPICDRITANKPEGLSMFYRVAYDVAMHMYQILNADV